MKKRSRRGPHARADFESLEKDKDFLALDAIGVPFDPFELMGVSHQERAFTRALSWMLDTKAGLGTQPFGILPLQSFVRLCLDGYEALPGASAQRVPELSSDIDGDTIEVLREIVYGSALRGNARAPDLVVRWRDRDGRQWVMVVEIKLDADEGTSQTNDYARWNKQAHPEAQRLLVFLTPDGRRPEVIDHRETVCCVRWRDVSFALSRALASRGEASAKGHFAVMALDAICARFGGDPEVEALVDAVSSRHMQAVARLQTRAPDTETGDFEKRFPGAVWRLRAARALSPRRSTELGSLVVTRRFAEAVAVAVNAHDGVLPKLRATAPHETAPHCVSWALGTLTERLGLQLMVTGGRAINAPSPRLWLGVWAPGLELDACLSARGQSEFLRDFPTTTAVTDVQSRWRWRCVGSPVTLPTSTTWTVTIAHFVERIVSLLDTVKALHERVRDDASQRLYSCDLDPELQLPTDSADRGAMESSPYEHFVRIGTRSPTGHPAELAPAHSVGLALIASFGGTGYLAYDYVPGPSVISTDTIFPTRSSVFIVGLPLFQHSRDSSLDALVTAIQKALDRSDTLILLGDQLDLDLARSLLPSLFAPIELFSDPTSIECDTTFSREKPRLVSNTPTHLTARVTLTSRATVLTTFIEAHTGKSWPLIARWSHGHSTVFLWLGGTWPMTLPSTDFARTFRTLTSVPG